MKAPKNSLFHSSYFSLTVPNPSALSVLQWDILIQYHHKCWSGYLSNQKSFYAVQLMLFSLGLWLWIIEVRIVVWGVFLNWIGPRQYYFVWVCSLTPPTLTHTSLSSCPSSDLLYREMSVKSGDEVWGNSSKSSGKDTAGRQPASTKETIAAPLCLHPTSQSFSERVCLMSLQILQVLRDAVLMREL